MAEPFSAPDRRFQTQVNSEAKARSAYAAYFGCTETHFVDYLLEEGTHHIDMWMKIVSPTTVLVGDYDY